MNSSRGCDGSRDMVDRINKALFRMSAKERKQILSILEQMKTGNVSSLDLKKLQGAERVYRVRKGSFRVIFSIGDSGSIGVLGIERRSDTTYRNI